MCMLYGYIKSSSSIFELYIILCNKICKCAYHVFITMCASAVAASSSSSSSKRRRWKKEIKVYLLILYIKYETYVFLIFNQDDGFHFHTEYIISLSWCVQAGINRHYQPVFFLLGFKHLCYCCIPMIIRHTHLVVTISTQQSELFNKLRMYYLLFT